MKTVNEWRELLTGQSPEDALGLIASENLVARFSTSLGMEDQVITHWIATQKLNIGVFTIDTGRLFQETYDLLDITRTKYKLNVMSYFPRQAAVEALLLEKGPNSFYRSIENRKECCYIRKVEPLKRALAGASVWITGIRSEQSANRQQMSVVEWDDQHQVIKFHPLYKWTQDQLESYIKEHRIPVNELHKKGFPSIGCAPCTRAVAEGEDPRSGRWWWEGAAKECGLHKVKVDL